MRHELAAGDRVFVWLTDAYLRSPYCMVELHELWRRADGDAKRFYDQVRLVLDVSIRHETEKAAIRDLRLGKEKAAIDEAARYVARMEGDFDAANATRSIASPRKPGRSWSSSGTTSPMGASKS